MNGGPPHWIPTETGPRLGDPLFLSKTRARGVAEGRAGARAGGWERPSSGVQIIFTSATSGWTLTGREARRASRCPGQVRDRGSVGRALPKPGASACAWTSRPPPGASVPLPAGPPPRSSRPRTAAGPAPSSPSQCPQSCVRLHEAPLHAPARAQPCEVRAEVRADCPGPGGVATGPQPLCFPAGRAGSQASRPQPSTGEAAATLSALGAPARARWVLVGPVAVAPFRAVPTSPRALPVSGACTLPMPHMVSAAGQVSQWRQTGGWTDRWVHRCTGR